MSLCRDVQLQIAMLDHEVTHHNMRVTYEALKPRAAACNFSAETSKECAKHMKRYDRYAYGVEGLDAWKLYQSDICQGKQLDPNTCKDLQKAVTSWDDELTRFRFLINLRPSLRKKYANLQRALYSTFSSICPSVTYHHPKNMPNYLSQYTHISKDAWEAYTDAALRQLDTPRTVTGFWGSLKKVLFN